MTMASTTIVVPTSGCSMISPTGTAATANAVATKPKDGRSSESARSARIIARPTQRATLANSDGCTEKPAGQQDPRVRAVDARAQR